METKVKPVESRDRAIRRLTVQAKSRGVQLFYYPQTREWYTSSQRNPGEPQCVTLLSCDWPGFFAHQRCMHNSLLLEELGELPGDPEPEPTPIRPLSTTVALETPKRNELQRFLQARAEVVRLSRDPKSTQDFRRLQNAQGRLAELTTPQVAAAS